MKSSISFLVQFDIVLALSVLLVYIVGFLESFYFNFTINDGVDFFTVGAVSVCTPKTFTSYLICLSLSSVGE